MDNNQTESRQDPRVISPTNSPQSAKPIIKWHTVGLIVLLGIVNAGVCWLIEEAIIRYVFPYVMTSDFYFTSGITAYLYYIPGLIEIVLVALFVGKKLNFNRIITVAVFVLFRIVLMYTIFYSNEISNFVVNTATNHHIDQPIQGEPQVASEDIYYNVGKVTYSLNVKSLQKKISTPDQMSKAKRDYWDSSSIDGSFKVKERHSNTTSVPDYTIISSDGKKEIFLPTDSFPEIWLIKSNVLITHKCDYTETSTTCSIYAMDTNATYKILATTDGQVSFYEY